MEIPLTPGWAFVAGVLVIPAGFVMIVLVALVKEALHIPDKVAELVGMTVLWIVSFAVSAYVVTAWWVR